MNHAIFPILIGAFVSMIFTIIVIVIYKKYQKKQLALRDDDLPSLVPIDSSKTIWKALNIIAYISTLPMIFGYFLTDYSFLLAIKHQLGIMKFLGYSLGGFTILGIISLTIEKGVGKMAKLLPNLKESEPKKAGGRLLKNYLKGLCICFVLSLTIFVFIDPDYRAVLTNPDNLKPKKNEQH